MANQSDSWDEVEVQWESAVTSGIRAKETSGSTDPGPTTGKSAWGELETTSVPDRGAVQRDSSLLALAGEDPDATLPYDPRRLSTLVPQEPELEVEGVREGSGNTLVPQPGASSNAAALTLSPTRGAVDGRNLTL